MGTSKVQQQNGSQQFNTMSFNIDMEKNNDKFHNIVYNKFDNKMWIQHCHLQPRDGEEEQPSLENTTTNHMPNNPTISYRLRPSLNLL